MVISQTRNSLMFSPNADQSPYNTANMVNSESDPKSIEHCNTQLPDDASSSQLSVPPSPTNSRIDAAVAGTPCMPPILLLLPSANNLTDHPRLPAINNYSLVPNKPSPTPSELGPAAVKQLMTWGTLGGTPRIISESDDDPSPSQPSTPFHLPAPSSREVISRKLSNNASKSLRAKAGLLGTRHVRTPGVSLDGIKGKGSMGPPTSVPRKADAAGNLTPAARSLLSRTSFGHRGGSGGGSLLGKEQDLNRVRWTPVASPVTKRS
jgi:protein DGCR14